MTKRAANQVPKLSGLKRTSVEIAPLPVVDGAGIGQVHFFGLALVAFQRKEHLGIGSGPGVSLV